MTFTPVPKSQPRSAPAYHFGFAFASTSSNRIHASAA
jgi:hypothetical protein